MVITGAGAVQQTAAATTAGPIAGMNAVFNSVLPASGGTAGGGTNAPTNATFNASYSGSMSAFYGLYLQHELQQQELGMYLQEKSRLGVGLSNNLGSYDPPCLSKGGDDASAVQDANSCSSDDGS
ncbi:MAG: hypothetical protein ACYCW6_04440 [Candidatus Xenobia bacterium]